MNPRRILISGVAGSGKTTLAKAVAANTGLPLIDVDELTWLPGWVEVPHDEQRRRVDQLTQQAEWVMDTAYGRWKDIPEPRAELIVCLDYPRWLSFCRLLRRTVARAIDRQPCCNGNVESWKMIFSKNSILLWHFRTFDSKRRRARTWAQDPTKTVMILSHPREAEQWLASLTPSGAPPSTDS